MTARGADGHEFRISFENTIPVCHCSAAQLPEEVM